MVPGTYGVEVSVSGKITYGYVWDDRRPCRRVSTG